MELDLRADPQLAELDRVEETGTASSVETATTIGSYSGTFSLGSVNAFQGTGTVTSNEVITANSAATAFHSLTLFEAGQYANRSFSLSSFNLTARSILTSADTLTESGTRSVVGSNATANFTSNGTWNLSQVSYQLQAGTLTAQGSYAAGSLNLSTIVFNNELTQNFTYTKTSYDSWTGGYTGTDSFSINGTGSAGFTEYGRGAWGNGSYNLSSYTFDGAAAGTVHQGQEGSANTKTYSHVQDWNSNTTNHQQATYAGGSYSFTTYSMTSQTQESVSDTVGDKSAQASTTLTVQITGTGQSGSYTLTYAAYHSFGTSVYSYTPEPLLANVSISGRSLPLLYLEGGTALDIVLPIVKPAGPIMGTSQYVPFPMLGNLGPLPVTALLQRAGPPWASAGSFQPKSGPLYETGPWKWLQDNRDQARWLINSPYDAAWARSLNHYKLDPLGFAASRLWNSLTAGASLFGVSRNFWAWVRETINLVAGFIDGITFGQSKNILKLWLSLSTWGVGRDFTDWLVDKVAEKLDGYVDRESSAYGSGQKWAKIVLIVATVTPLGAVGTVIRVLGMLGSAFNMVEAARDGDWKRFSQSALDFLLVGLRGLTRCNLPGTGGLRVATEISFGITTMAGVVNGISNAAENFKKGDILGGVLDLLQAGASIFQASRACFTADMKILTRRGWVRMDELRPGDWVATCDQNDPLGPIVFKPVLEVFEFVGAEIWHVHVRDRVIRTTAEHPFYVWGKGWVQAQKLEAGDRFRSHDGEMVTVQEVFATGVEEPVYNCAVEDYHTYFVGGEDWGFSVWAHNACEQKRDREGKFLPKTGKERRPGSSFEDKVLNALGLSKNKTRFPSTTDDGKPRNTFPDAVRPNGGPVVEIKSGRNVNLDPQLQAQINLGRGVELIVRRGARVSRRLIRRVGRENIRVFDARTGTFSEFP